jgi:hypothetical protein
VKQKLLQAFSGLVDSVVAAAPKFVVGILLVIAGFIVAKLIEVVLRYMLSGSGSTGSWKKRASTRLFSGSACASS